MLLFHQIVSLKKNGKAARQYRPFHQFSISYQSKSPHISRFTILLSKLISEMCLCHLHVVWWHFQKRQEVLTLSGTGRELLCLGTTQRPSLCARVSVGLNATVRGLAVIILMRHL